MKAAVGHMMVAGIALLCSGSVQAQSLDAPWSNIPWSRPVDTAQPLIPDVLFQALVAAPSRDQADALAVEIIRLWRLSASETVTLLFEQAASLQEAEQYEAARDKLSGLVNLAPHAAEAWAMRGEVLVALGEIDLALSDLETATELEPRHFRAWAGLARLREEKENWREALEAYKRLDALYPQMQGVQARIKALEAIPKETQL